MNKLQKNAEKINEDRKKFVPFEYAYEVLLGITVLKDDGSVKGRIECADDKGVFTTIRDDYGVDKNQKCSYINYKDLYKNWILETQPGNIMIAGKLDDSGLIISK